MPCAFFALGLNGDYRLSSGQSQDIEARLGRLPELLKTVGRDRVDRNAHRSDERVLSSLNSSLLEDVARIATTRRSKSFLVISTSCARRDCRLSTIAQHDSSGGFWAQLRLTYIRQFAAQQREANAAQRRSHASAVLHSCCTRACTR